jgi:hypothetical protein
MSSWEKIGHRRDFTAVAQAITDRDRAGVARQRDHVALAEHAGIRDDAAANVGEQHAVAALVEADVAARVLDRLEVDAANAVPLQRMLDDGAHLVVVGPLFHDADQRRRDVVALEVFQRLLADAGQVGPADRLQCLGTQRVEGRDLRVNGAFMGF